LEELLSSKKAQKGAFSKLLGSKKAGVSAGLLVSGQSAGAPPDALAALAVTQLSRRRGLVSWYTAVGPGQRSLYHEPCPPCGHVSRCYTEFAEYGVNVLVYTYRHVRVQMRGCIHTHAHVHAGEGAIWTRLHVV